MRYPGEVWFLPPEARDDGDPKWRRHVLLTVCEEEDDVGVFSYASTWAIEAAFGGASHLVDPYARAYRHTGFTAPTYVTPCRLVPTPSGELKRMAGRIIDEMPDIRRELARAIGLGTGTARAGAASGSLRGSVVELSDGLAEESGARFCVVVTEPGYSLARRYQLILPILDAGEYESEAGDVVVHGSGWAAGIFRSPTVLVPPRLIQTAFHPTELRRVLPAVVDDATIGEIDRALVQMFGL